MDPNERLHTEWLGMAQPEGLVVTVAALKDAEANITWPIADRQAALRELAGERKQVADLPALFRDILDWSGEYLVSGADVPPSLRVRLDGGDEVLVPSFAVRSADESQPPDTFVLLVEATHRTHLDAASDDKRWSATPHQRFERLLREAGVGVGLLTNGRDFRLVYAPRGESAGWVTFRLSDMLTVDGRPLLGAFHMLLNERRLLSLGEGKRLGDLLKASREYQSTVSTKLREQLLAALRDLLLGFQHADSLSGGEILREYRREGRLQEVYLGLVTVLMRSVFVLFAEERGLLPMESDLYASGYSLSRLHAQLQADRDQHGDTIDDRYGAWGRVITLVRLLHDGVRAADGLFIPARKGSFFDPDTFPFLEGRPRGSVRQTGETLDLPRVSDGVVFRVLDRLLMLDGERLQYKGLDVEQIGSVYEGLMGFEVEVAEGDSLCVMPEHVVVDLEALLAVSGAERGKRLKERAGLEMKAQAGKDLGEAKDVAGLHAALGRRVSPRQPGILAKGSLYLQPGEERRKTGSHYTPRALTQPIVETTLRPVLERLGAEVKPKDILDLKICDPAMGSGAFLVEACRQLAERLVEAWRRTGSMPVLPPDEVPDLHARRLIAQRCIYGVDKNPLAADLARLSMWLVTFAKDHPFTFVDHSLRAGDSLVGLSKEQITSFTLDMSKGAQIEIARSVVAEKVQQAAGLRRQLHAIGDPPDNTLLAELWHDADGALTAVRLLGDTYVAAYFSTKNERERREQIDLKRRMVMTWLTTGESDFWLRMGTARLREGPQGVSPFHWEAEFPEVFERENPGFDCVVGNPPFLGGTIIGGRLGLAYHDFLVDTCARSTGNADVVAFFLRQAFRLLRRNGTFGLIATNTVAQGDTRISGLEHIVSDGGAIYDAQRRYKWPGEAAVVVSVVHAIRGAYTTLARLNGVPVARITSFLFHGHVDTAPSALMTNKGLGYIGIKIWGSGFLFEENPSDGASSIVEMNQLMERDPLQRELVFSYMGGEEFNDSPTQSARRFVINFGEMRESEARRWPDLFSIVEARVKPVRASNKQRNYREDWWLYANRVPEAIEFAKKHGRLIAFAQTSRHLSVAFVASGTIPANTLLLALFHTCAALAALQSSIHECWARFLGSSMKDDLRYTASDCFETFPFPPGILPGSASPASPALEAIGQTYYDHRAALMIANNEGLTKTYNRFHHPDERSPGIVRLRELHAAMDRAVLDAYGWTDIVPAYDFRPQLDESTRYTWAEETRDEVLAHLLEQNQVMAAREAKQVAARAEAEKLAKKAGAVKKRGKKDEATLALPMGEKKRDG
jgi:N-6 DNA Methylase